MFFKKKLKTPKYIMQIIKKAEQSINQSTYACIQNTMH